MFFSNQISFFVATILIISPPLGERAQLLSDVVPGASWPIQPAQAFICPVVEKLRSYLTPLMVSMALLVCQSFVRPGVLLRLSVTRLMEPDRHDADVRCMRSPGGRANVAILKRRTRQVAEEMSRYLKDLIRRGGANVAIVEKPPKLTRGDLNSRTLPERER